MQTHFSIQSSYKKKKKTYEKLPNKQVQVKQNSTAVKIQALTEPSNNPNGICIQVRKVCEMPILARFQWENAHFQWFGTN